MRFFTQKLVLYIGSAMIVTCAGSDASAQIAPNPIPPQERGNAEAEARAKFEARLTSRAEFFAQRGVELYRYDRAFKDSRDAMRKELPANGQPQERGWVTTPTEEGLETVFYTIGKDDIPQGIYRTLWKDRLISGKRLTEPSELKLTAEELRLVDLRNRSIGDRVKQCEGHPVNILVIPSGRPTGGIDSVYYVATSDTNTNIQLGGHYRVDYQDGAKVSERSFARGCETVDLNSSTSNSTSKTATINYEVDRYPSELHSYWMMYLGQPLDVVTTSSYTRWSLRFSNGKVDISRVFTR